MADSLTCHSRDTTGVTNNINKGSVPFTCPCKSFQRASVHNTRTLRLAHLNGMQLLFMLLITPVLFLLYDKMSAVKLQWSHSWLNVFFFLLQYNARY